MPQVRYTTEQIIHKLREIEVVVAQGISIKQACRQCSIADKTCYKWREEYRGLRMDQAKRFKEIEKEYEGTITGVVDDSPYSVNFKEEPHDHEE